MTKREMALLERLFAAEIEDALRKNAVRVFQTRSALIHRLHAQGYVEPISQTVGRAFPVTIRGWRLTLAGHAAYCLTC